jgi:F420-0:gamma-glutamyl ligase
LEVVFPRVTVGNEHRVLLASAGISRETVSNDSRIIAPEERFRSAEVFGSELGNLRFRV